MSFQLSPEVDRNKIFLVQRSELEGRLDPHFYKPFFKKNAQKIDSVNNKKLAEIVKFSNESWNQKDIFSVTFPYIEIGEIDLLTGEINKIHDVSFDDAPSRAKMIVRNGDILISTTRPSRGAISHLEDDGLYIASTGFSIAREILEKNISKRFLFYWLRQPCSLYQMEQRSSGGNYPAITQEELAKIKIPVPPKEIQSNIVATMDAAYAAKKQKEAEAQRLLDSIDDYLLGELGIDLPEQKENTIQNRIFTRRLSEVSGGRFDAQSCRPYYERISECVATSKYRVKQLKDIVKKIQRPFPPVENREYFYIQLGSIGRGNSEVGTPRKIQLPNIPSRAQQIVKSGELLFSITNPQWGVHILVKEEYDDYVASSGFVILKSENHNNIFVIELLRTYLYRKLYEKYLTGAGLFLNISEIDLMNIKIPLPPLSKQTDIANHITAIRQQAKQLQQQAKAELEQAKKEVESIILGDHESLA